MQILNNINQTVRSDLQATIKKGSNNDKVYHSINLAGTQRLAHNNENEGQGE